MTVVGGDVLGDEDQYRLAKEAMVSGLTGASPAYVQLVSFVGLVTTTFLFGGKVSAETTSSRLGKSLSPAVYREKLGLP